MTYHDALVYTVVVIDVVGSASHPNPWQLQMRADLRAIVTGALTRQGYDPVDIDLSDTGDGVRLIFSPRIPSIGLVSRFIPDLWAALSAHRTAVPDRGLRLRVAMDIGLLHRDHGWHGTPLILCSRLCDARPVRAAVRAASGADLVFVVSPRVYDEVVRHGYDRIDAAAYRMIEVREKETTTAAWIHVPGYAGLPHVSDAEVPAEPRTSQPGAVTMSATAFGDSRVYQAAGDQHINER